MQSSQRAAAHLNLDQVRRNQPRSVSGPRSQRVRPERCAVTARRVKRATARRASAPTAPCPLAARHSGFAGATRRESARTAPAARARPGTG
jgi:hypothetical protein